MDTARDSRDKARQLIERDRAVIARPGSRIPIAIERASGAMLYDYDGRGYLDFTSGWNVANVGWCHPAVLAATKRQLSLLPFAPNWCTSETRVALCERLAALGGGNWVTLPAVGGSEAIEQALKVARRATGRHTVVSFEGAYHGGTLGALLAGGGPQAKRVFPANNAYRYVPLPDKARSDWLAAAVAQIKESPPAAAVLFEPIFTNPGMLFGRADQYQQLVSAAKSVGALVICDEVGTGFGRTGEFFAYQHFGIIPDIVVVAKAMTSGVVPCGAALMHKELASHVSGKGFSPTYGCTPLAAAAALATIEVIVKEGLVERSGKLGERARKAVAARIPRIKKDICIRGKGLSIGVELLESGFSQAATDFIRAECLERGVFLETASRPNTILIMPPLIIQEELLLEGIGALCTAIERQWAPQ